MIPSSARNLRRDINVDWVVTREATQKFKEEVAAGNNVDRAMRKLMRAMTTANFSPELMSSKSKAPERRLLSDLELPPIGIVNPFHSTIVYELSEGGEVELYPPPMTENSRLTTNDAYNFLQVSKTLQEAVGGIARRRCLLGAKDEYIQCGRSGAI